MTHPLIEMNNLTQKAGQCFLLKNIHWDIYSGQNWLLFGENGCGKTSLLSIIAGLSSYHSGELLFRQKPYNAKTIQQIQKEIGFISNSFWDKCFSHETALEIVLSGLLGGLQIPDTLTSQHIKTAKRLLSQLLHTPYLYNHPYDLLSKGQRQCVLIARVLLNPPPIIIWDEPTAGLDLKTRAMVINVMQRFYQDPSITNIFVTHDIKEISDYITNCLLMKNGQVVSQGSLSEVFSPTVLSEYFNCPVSISKKHNKIIDISFDVPELILTPPF